MATYDLRQKTNASTGQKVVPSQEEIRVQNLENKVNLICLYLLNYFYNN